jgi:hypothetical protein
MSNLLLAIRRIGFAAAVAALAPGIASAQSLAYVGGVQYATGDFIFTQRTWSAYLSNGLSWSAGRFRATASVPLVFQAAGWLPYNGAGMMVPTGGLAGIASNPESVGSSMGNGMHGGSMTPSNDMPFGHVGIGDPVARIDAALLRTEADHPLVSFVGAVKAPLADVNRGFGTGQWDLGAGFSSTATVGGTSVFAEAVYWKLGKPPGSALRNAVAYAVSVGRPLASGPWSVLGTVSGATSLWTGLEAPVQAGLSVGYVLVSGRSVFATAAAGLTRTAPTISTGLGWRVPLGMRR